MRCVLHQVSKAHTRAVADTLQLDMEKIPLIFPDVWKHRPGRGPDGAVQGNQGRHHQRR